MEWKGVIIELIGGGKAITPYLFKSLNITYYLQTSQKLLNELLQVGS